MSDYQELERLNSQSLLRLNVALQPSPHRHPRQPKSLPDLSVALTLVIREFHLLVLYLCCLRVSTDVLAHRLLSCSPIIAALPN